MERHSLLSSGQAPKTPGMTALEIKKYLLSAGGVSLYLLF